MPHTRSAIKRLHQAEKRRARNRIVRSRVRTFIKKTDQLIAAGRLDEAQEMAQQAASALDKAASKGVIHKNNAARHKSRLVQRLNAALHSTED